MMLCMCNIINDKLNNKNKNFIVISFNLCGVPISSAVQTFPNKIKSAKNVDLSASIST